MSLLRRTLLTAALGTAATVGLAACGTQPRPDAGGGRRRYGSGKDQYGDLLLPEGRPIATVVSIHGGYWYSDYGLDLMNPIAGSLVEDGAAVWNIEYSRIGDGGGWPSTFTDVAAAIDALPGLEGLPDGAMDKVLVLGHSAGGHLAVWASSRTAKTPGGASKVRFDGCVSLAGVLDLTTGSQQGLGGGAVDMLMGGSSEQHPERYAVGDPTRLVPASCPVVATHGTDDGTVPKDQSTSYVAAARAAGGDATYVEVPGDHFDQIDPSSAAWRTTTRALAGFVGK